VPGDKQISTDLPEIHLKDIGKKKNGASAAEVAQEIFAALYGKVTSPQVIGALNDQVKKLGGAAAEAVQGVAEEGVKQATGAVESAGKEATGGITDTVKGLLPKKD
jgi:hypothetical protein